MSKYYLSLVKGIFCPSGTIMSNPFRLSLNSNLSPACFDSKLFFPVGSTVKLGYFVIKTFSAPFFSEKVILSGAIFVEKVPK